MRRIVALFVALAAAAVFSLPAADRAVAMNADGGGLPPGGCTYLTPTKCATSYAMWQLIYGVWYCEPIKPGYCYP